MKARVPEPSALIVVSCKLTRDENTELCRRLKAAGMTRYALLQYLLRKWLRTRAAEDARG